MAGEVEMDYDVFVCHASEDKDFVEPLANALKDKGLKVWYAPLELKIGDSLRQEIDRGLANSRYGIVVLSEAFFKKNWPQSELDALASRQNEEGRKVILPIWHEIGASEVQKHSPLLAGLLAARSQDGLASVVGQILTVCSEPEKPGSERVFFQASGKSGLRERCLDIIRRGDRSEWVKLIDELQAPIDEQLIAWKKEGEAAVGKGVDVWRSMVLKATEICLPGFVPIFAAVEAGQKELWKDATRILRRLAILENKMGGGIPHVLRIGMDMLYLPGSIGMAIAVGAGRHDFVCDWMLLTMPGYRNGTEMQWAEIRAAFWPPVEIDFQDPFRFLLGLYNSEHIRALFPSEERMEEFLFKANLLASIVELRLLTRTKRGAEIVEKRDEKYKSNVKVVPSWSLIKNEDFRTWTLDLFGSSEGFIRFFMMGSGGHIEPERIWNWWKGWKVICEAFLDEVTRHRLFLRTEWLMLPGEPAGNL